MAENVVQASTQHFASKCTVDRNGEILDILDTGFWFFAHFELKNEG
jgi:hypothetical protein